MNYFKLNLKPITECSSPIELIEAYKNTIASSSKFDVEYKTPYGKRKMKLDYEKFAQECKKLNLKPLDVAAELAGYDF